MTLYGKFIIQRKNIIGRLFRYFQIYFLGFSAPTMESLFLLVLSMLAIFICVLVSLEYWSELLWTENFPYKDETFSQYKDTSVQEFRLALSQQINQQVIFAIFVKNVETTIKSNAFIKALKSALRSVGYHG